MTSSGRRRATTTGSHHQCSADWILRLDDDELPSRGPLEALPRLAGDRRLSRVHLPCRHLHPDLGHYLASHPWHPDYHARLVRNVPGLWRFDGRTHHEPEALGEHRREPAPFYHLRYLATTEAQRLDTAERSERALPGRLSEAYPVNALYLPGRWSGVRVSAVPAHDRGLIAAVATPAPARRGRAPRLERASRRSTASTRPARSRRTPTAPRSASPPSGPRCSPGWSPTSRSPCATWAANAARPRTTPRR